MVSRRPGIRPIDCSCQRPPGLSFLLEAMENISLQKHQRSFIAKEVAHRCAWEGRTHRSYYQGLSRGANGWSIGFGRGRWGHGKRHTGATSSGVSGDHICTEAAFTFSWIAPKLYRKESHYTPKDVRHEISERPRQLTLHGVISG